MKFLAEIKDKFFDFGNIKYVRFHLGKLEGKKVLVTVQRIHNKRSLNQNRYYWMCLRIISYHTGHDDEELHTIFKAKFLPKREIVFKDIRYMTSGSTTDLTKGQFVEFMMNISAEASSMGIILPSPEDYKRGLDEAVLSTSGD